MPRKKRRKRRGKAEKKIKIPLPTSVMRSRMENDDGIREREGKKPQVLFLLTPHTSHSTF
jgi:hypothetical protein